MKEKRSFIINKKTYHYHLNLECELLKIQLIKKKREEKKKVTATFDRVLAWFVLQTKS